jgi:hypothetical protein
MLTKDTNKKKKTILFFCDSQVQKEGVIENSEYNLPNDEVSRKRDEAR